MQGPGLVVLDVAAADAATAFTLQAVFAERWATVTAEDLTREPGQPGVRLRCYLDLRQPFRSDPASRGRLGRRPTGAPSGGWAVCSPELSRRASANRTTPARRSAELTEKSNALSNSWSMEGPSSRATLIAWASSINMAEYLPVALVGEGCDSPRL
ncbi:DUF6207 family protein [Streptomyces sp. LBL]|uniref:DUF6207 family protein n=1 Tax=Streptomyces sp. LBL TaxID=2940562 RepID=UPI002474A1BD|nr:DUF6207 family protein [Streptomyces sp. LBL]